MFASEAKETTAILFPTFKIKDLAEADYFCRHSQYTEIPMSPIPVPDFGFRILVLGLPSRLNLEHGKKPKTIAFVSVVRRARTIVY